MWYAPNEIFQQISKPLILSLDLIWITYLPVVYHEFLSATLHCYRLFAYRYLIHITLCTDSADGSVNNLFSYMLGADGTKRRLIYLVGQSDKYWERYIVLTYCDHFLLNKLKSLR